MVVLTTFDPCTLEAEKGGESLRVRDHSALHSEFQISQGYPRRTYLNFPTPPKKPTKQNPLTLKYPYLLRFISYSHKFSLWQQIFQYKGTEGGKMVELLCSGTLQELCVGWWISCQSPLSDYKFIVLCYLREVHVSLYKVYRRMSTAVPKSHANSSQLQEIFQEFIYKILNHILSKSFKKNHVGYMINDRLPKEQSKHSNK